MPLRFRLLQPTLTRLITVSILTLSTFVAHGAGLRALSIPAQPLAAALAQFSEQTGIKTIYAGELLQGKVATRVEGTLTPEQALDRLLAGTGLRYEMIGSDVARIETRPSTKESEMPRMVVRDTEEAPPTGYVVRSASAGTKSDTPILLTPLNIQALPQQVVEDQQALDLSHALANVSGVTTVPGARGYGPRDADVVLRGFRTKTVYRDGLRLDDGFGVNQQLADVEIVEVLKGPAAILYGRGEPGGMVNLVTKQPQPVAGYAFEQQAGSYGLLRSRIDATGPLDGAGRFLYRFNASYQRNDSFRDLVNNRDVFLAPTLRFNASQDTRFTLAMHYQHQRSSQDGPILAVDPLNNLVLDNIPHASNLSESNPVVTETRAVRLTTHHDFNQDWSIEHKISFNGQRNDAQFAVPLFIDPDNLVYRIGFLDKITHDTLATNLDMSGHFATPGMAHSLLLGADYLRLKTKSDNASASDITVVDYFHPVHVGPSAYATDPTTGYQGIATVDNIGIYVQDQISVASAWQLLLGARYQSVHATSAQTGFDANGLPDGLFAPAPVQRDHAVTPRVGVLWQPSASLSLYANYVKNFGANTGAFRFSGYDAAGSALPPALLGPETGRQFELGAKTEILEGRLHATLSLYNLKKQNVAQGDPTIDTTKTPPQRRDCGSGPGSCSIAIGEVTSKGIELDVQGQLSPAWNVIASAAYVDSRITRSNLTDPETGFAIGSRLTRVPRSTGSLWMTHEVRADAFSGLLLGGGFTAQSSAVNYNNTIRSAGFGLLNLMARYQWNLGKAHLIAQLNIENALDKRFYFDADSHAGLPATVTFGTPRTANVSVKLTY